MLFLDNSANFQSKLMILASGVASPICWEGGGQSKRPLPFLTEFPLFHDFLLLFPDFSQILAIFLLSGGTLNPLTPSGYATDFGTRIPPILSNLVDLAQAEKH